MIGVIAGSGLYKLIEGKEKKIKTPYGVCRLIINNKIAFLPRHGLRHTIPPHKINHKANIFALKKLGIKKIMGIGSSGIINKKFKPGDLILPHDFIDFSGIHTYFDSFEKGIKHTDFSIPFSKSLRGLIIKSSGKKIHKKAVYLNTLGPRFETPAEIKFFKKIGADIVGMTLCPEAILARELGMEYAALCIGTNYCSGISKKPISHKDVIKKMEEKNLEIKELLRCLAK